MNAMLQYFTYAIPIETYEQLIRPRIIFQLSNQTDWLSSGDVFYVNWDEVLAGATAVVSTLGGFGSEEQMQRINGEANVVAVNAAKEYGEYPVLLCCLTKMVQC